MELNTREVAALVWFGLLAIGFVAAPLTRRHVPQLLQALVKSSILVPFATMVVYVAAVVAGAWWLGVWEWGLLKDTLVWFITTAVVLFFNLNAAMTDRGFFRRAATQTLEFSILAQFLLGLFPLSLPVEFFLQGFVAFLAIISVFSQAKPDLLAAKRVADAILVGIGLVLVVLAVVDAATTWDTLKPVELLEQFFLPVVLTLTVLPFIYVLASFGAYQATFSVMRATSPDDVSLWRARLALALKLRGHLPEVMQFRQPWLRKAAVAPSIRAAMAVVDDRREALRQRNLAEQRAEARLREYAGVQGVDSDGRQLDQREFEETRDSLQYLASCQMGHYRSKGKGYRPELLDMLQDNFVRKGLPAAHGIKLHVTRDRKAWWAYRATASGWVLAIGAKGPPPDLWFYDGSDVPTGPPGRDRRWQRGQGPGFGAPNW
jgi:hypothetical protein